MLNIIVALSILGFCLFASLLVVSAAMRGSQCTRAEEKRHSFET